MVGGHAPLLERCIRARRAPGGHSVTDEVELSTNPSRRLRALLLDPLDGLGEEPRPVAFPPAVEAAEGGEVEADDGCHLRFTVAREESASGLAKQLLERGEHRCPIHRESQWLVVMSTTLSR